MIKRLTPRCRRSSLDSKSGHSDPVEYLSPNAARVLLNGTEIGAQQEAEIFRSFQDPAESYTASGPFVAGTNVLEFVVRNFSGPMGLNFKVDATYTLDTPPTLELPDDITVNATGPDEALVAYSVTASDDSDPSPDVRAGGAAGGRRPTDPGGARLRVAALAGLGRLEAIPSEVGQEARPLVDG